MKDALENVGINDSIASALLACFEKVAWIDEYGQDYYYALEAALQDQKKVSSISAVFTQSGNKIYDGDSLDALRQYLVVTATYDDRTSAVVTNYSLQGTLSVGTSTITVRYGGKTATFNATVTWGYKLREQFTATETTGVNTGKRIALGETYTIALEFVVTGVNSTYNGVDFIWGNRHPDSNTYTGLQNTRDQGTNNLYMWGCGVSWDNGQNKLVLNNRYRIVHTLSIISGNKVFYTYAKNVTAGTTYTYNTTSATTTDYPEGNRVYISQGMSGNGFNGTVYDFVIEKGIWDSNKINAYLAG